MLGTKAELKKTRFYQEIQEEEREVGKEVGKEEVRMTVIPMLLKAGISAEEFSATAIKREATASQMMY